LAVSFNEKDELLWGHQVFGIVKELAKGALLTDETSPQSPLLRLLNSLLEILFLEDFFKTFVSRDHTLMEQEYFNRLDGLSNKGLSELITKKITYSQSKLFEHNAVC
jgi:hypothetical protein